LLFFPDLTIVTYKLYRRRRSQGEAPIISPEEIAKLVRAAWNSVPPRRKDNERYERLIHLRNHHVDDRESFNVLALSL
jgi:putative SOS response-associated peptidase YedK